ncbi:MAG: non-heme iron oxygenase ferredoxin subunit [Dehalococcoidia bacterium]|nr:non-heme iron oxygenase ferredoxin subunit [Dehalococcoidia bacterium]MDW8120210.1 non-heme iron oxygenase ferredoxin subunit [Chloroflexota bacterium]
MPERWVAVASVRDVPPGTVRVVRAGGESLALCNVNGQFYAVQNLCTHDGGPLGEGELVGYAVECPRHGARFDVRTGTVLALPAVRPIRTYKTRVQGETIEVALPT